MTAFAWAVLCPHHAPTLRLEQAAAYQYAVEHHGQVIPLMREDHASELVQAAWQAGFLAGAAKHERAQ